MNNNPIIKSSGVGRGSRSLIYSVPSAYARQNFIHIDSLADASQAFPEAVIKAHSHDFYLIVWFWAGSGKMVIDFKSYDIAPNAIFFIPPGQIHQFVGLKYFRGINISFSEEFLNNLSASSKNIVKQRLFSIQNGASICYITQEHSNLLLKHCQRINHQIENPFDDTIQKDSLASLLSLFLLNIIQYGKLNKSLSCNQVSLEYKVYLDFMDSVEANYKIVHTASGYVDITRVPLSTLNKYITKVSGKTPSRIVSERIVIEAKRMLYEHPEWRIKEIAQKLGFEDNSNFVKFFKRYGGMSPTEFRDSV